MFLNSKSQFSRHRLEIVCAIDDAFLLVDCRQGSAPGALRSQHRAHPQQLICPPSIRYSHFHRPVGSLENSLPNWASMLTSSTTGGVSIPPPQFGIVLSFPSQASVKKLLVSLGCHTAFIPHCGRRYSAPTTSLTRRKRIIAPSNAVSIVQPDIPWRFFSRISRTQAMPFSLISRMRSRQGTVL